MTHSQRPLKDGGAPAQMQQVEGFSTLPPCGSLIDSGCSGGCLFRWKPSLGTLVAKPGTESVCLSANEVVSVLPSFLLCMGVLLHVCLCTIYLPSNFRGQEMSDSLG